MSKEIKVTKYKNNKGAKIDIYSPNSKSTPHDSVHIKVNTDNKTFQTVTKIDGKKETSSGSCYLTTACLNYYKQNFDDNCYELNTLRIFRDIYVSSADISHYYEVAPLIVEAINNCENNEKVYEYIYNNVINPCVLAIELNEYEFAYEIYKNSILALEKVLLKEDVKQRVYSKE